jgi:hypothetical protein
MVMTIIKQAATPDLNSLERAGGLQTAKALCGLISRPTYNLYFFQANVTTRYNIDIMVPEYSENKRAL